MGNGNAIYARETGKWRPLAGSQSAWPAVSQPGWQPAWLASPGSPQAQAVAVGALKILADDYQNQDRIREEGGIQALIKVLRESSQEAQTHDATDWFIRAL